MKNDEENPIIIDLTFEEKTSSSNEKIEQIP